MSFLVVALLAFVLAFLGSIPIAGPISVMVVARGVEGRFTEARKLAIGSACAEGVWAGLAFATFATVFARYPAILPVSRAITSLVLLVVGVQFVRWKPREIGPADESRRSAGGLGFVTSLLNPTLFATWSATATALQARHLVETATIYALPFGLGAAAGIAAWFATLITLMTRYRSRLPQRLLTGIVRGTGALLIALALWTGVSAAIR